MSSDHDQKSILPGFPALTIFIGFCAFALAGCGAALRCYQMDICNFRICDGQGGRKPFLSNRDNFSLFLDYLKDPDPVVRHEAGFIAGTSRALAGPRYYAFVVEAYLDAGRVDELFHAVQRAREAAPPGSLERHYLAKEELEIKVRSYVWSHPDALEFMGLVPAEPPGRSLSLSTMPDSGFQTIVERMIGEGDADVKRAWEEYNQPWTSSSD